MAELVTKYQQYAEYKDSGVEWLGNIPKEWEMWKLAHAYLEIGSGTTPPSNNEEWYVGDIPWITTGELRESLILDTKKKISQKTIKAFPTLRIYPVGSIAIAMYGATIGRLGILGMEATTNQACCVMSQSNVIFNKFLYYWMQGFKDDIVRLSSGGGQPNINQETVASLKVSSPQYQEQIQIANFLDHETAQIDTLIEKQQTLIQLLKEKRQAVISHAVTKGLNPDAPMKDSGVEWLGEVPEHWEVMPLKYAVTFQRGHDLPAQNRTAGDVPLVTSAGISSTHNIAIAKAPGLVTGRYGTIGKFNLLEEDYWPLNTTLYSINLRGNNPKYLWYMLHNLTPIFLANSLKSAVPGVDRNDLHVVKVAMPKNLAEQEALCDYLEKTHCKYDLVIEKASESLVLLQERRTALISAAVTGKIDVKGWQVPDSEAF